MSYFDAASSPGSSAIPVEASAAVLRNKELLDRLLVLEGRRPAIIRPTLYSGWSNFDAVGSGWDEVKAVKDNGMVTLSGMTQGGSGTIINLPPGYRPGGSGSALIFPVWAGGSIARCDIYDTGDVIYQGTSGSWVSLSGITFLAGA